MTQHIEHKTLKERVTILIEGLNSDIISLSELLELIGKEGILVFCIFLTLPFMVPVSIPGVSTIFGTLIIVLGFSYLCNRKITVPMRFQHKTLNASALKNVLEKGLIWVTRVEKISRPRLNSLTESNIAHFINSGALILGGILLIMPLAPIPFSNTLPGLVILLLAIGILQRDGVCILMGFLMTVATFIYFAFILAGSAIVLQKLVEFIKSF